MKEGADLAMTKLLGHVNIKNTENTDANNSLDEDSPSIEN